MSRVGPREWFQRFAERDGDWIRENATKDFTYAAAIQTPYLRYGDRDRVAHALASPLGLGESLELELGDVLASPEHVVALGFVHACDRHGQRVSGRFVQVFSILGEQVRMAKFATENSLAVDLLLRPPDGLRPEHMSTGRTWPQSPSQ